MGTPCSIEGSRLSEAEETTFIHKNNNELKSRMPESMRVKTKLIPRAQDSPQNSERRSLSTGQLYEEIRFGRPSQGRRREYLYRKQQRYKLQKVTELMMKSSPLSREKTLEDIIEVDS
uniref:Uncharacterized protein n=1 Tax=Lotharella globosa TaxID=91324 RepID=A0A7S3Z7T9_9EUKA